MKKTSTVGLASALVLALALGGVSPVRAADSDLAQTGKVTASSTQADSDGTFPAGNAIDGNPATRWASAKGPDADTPFTATITSALAKPSVISEIDLSWETAYAVAYRVQVASSAAVPTWRTVHAQSKGDGGLDRIVLPTPLPAGAVRVVMTKRAAVTWQPGAPHWYGYSLYSFEVHGTVTSDPPAPSAGRTEVLQDFSAGVPTDYLSWSSTPSVKPALSTVVEDSVPSSAPGNAVLVAKVAGTPAESDFFGFANDIAARDWSHWDGFQFWYLGSGSGRSLSFELKSGGQLFDRTVVDDTPGWRQISALFGDLRLKGDPASPARFNPNASTGFAVTLTGLGSGTFAFDRFALFERATTLDDFEGALTIGATTNPVGYFPWFSAGATVTLSTESQARGDRADNQVLAGSAAIPSAGFGGFSDNLATSQDWSSYRGIRFWWYASQSSNPASPTAGDDITVEIKDGGPNGEQSERWTATFKDNWGSSTSRWKLVQLPFGQFTLAGYQPGSGGTLNGSLDLSTAWGFGLTLPTGKPSAVRFAIDDVQLYGTPVVVAQYAITTDSDVYLVDQGESASVAVTVTTPNRDPLAADLSVQYTVGAGATAVAGKNYADPSGSLTFPAGTPSGSSTTVSVHTLAVAGGDQAPEHPDRHLSDWRSAAGHAAASGDQRARPAVPEPRIADRGTGR